MDGRNYIPPNALNSRHHRQLLVNPPLLQQRSRLSSSELRILEERIATQSREIQTLIHDNQRLAVIHVALKQEMIDAEQDIRQLSATASSVKAERDAQVRDVYLRSLKIEEEARSVEGIPAELDRVRTDIHELRSERNELSEKLKDINGDIATSRLEMQELPSIEAETEATQREILRGRTAIEYERKMYAKNCELSEVMEKHLISMTQEAEKLRSELANAERRAMAAAAAAVASATPAESHALSVPPGPYDINSSSTFAVN